MKLFIISSIAATVFLFGFTAQAQESTQQTKEGYGYVFEDDPLAAGGFGPNDSMVRVRRGAQRSTLIKPRTQFIAELIKSVEAL